MFNPFYYINADEAKKMGMTHHASYHFVPMWVSFVDDGESDMLWCAKWGFNEYTFSFLYFIESIFWYLLFSQPYASFDILDEIE